MRIGEFAARTGTSPRLLRYYEQQGLLHPERGLNGYREYGEHLELKVLRIRGLLSAGMPIALIHEILPCFTGDDSASQFILEQQIVDRILAHRARIDAKLTCLSASRDAIDAYLEHVGGGVRTGELVAGR